MKESEYNPVLHDHASMLERALKKKGARAAYDALDEEYALLRELLRARLQAGMTQDQVADAMGTTKSAVARLESFSGHSPSFSTLRRYAHAVGGRIEIRIVSSGTEQKYEVKTKKKKRKVDNMETPGSPLDVDGIDSDLTAEEIVAAVREGRER